MKDNPISYRKIEPSDNESLKQLVQRGLAAYGLDIPGTAYFDPYLDHLYEYYEEDPRNRYYFVATSQDGRVVGGGGLDIFKGFEDCAELQKLYVDEEFRERGIGSHLIDLIEKEALRKGFKFIYLETHSNLQAAQRLYEKCGYKLMERQPYSVHETMDRFFIKSL